MEHSERSYIPAAGQHWMLPLYDTMVWMLGGDASRRKLIEQAAIQGGHRVLDIGCGTGSLAVMLKKTHPGAEVVGLDPDPKVLSIARGKAERSGVRIEFDQGFSDHLAYAGASFDRVFSSFMFHHLPHEERSATLAEIRRVLKTGGSLHLVDFVPARSGFARAMGHLFHGGHHGIEDQVVPLMEKAGFADSAEVEYGSTLFGSIAYFRACRKAIN
ncbi:MAG: class I SAM-dependent methyltransferase [Candidatus Binatus sp.]|uniref:class I SAM-dependent methyltransferase n=1 Tax=Candidatus Binatus sp. TaxID=2811406 RepID=UPI0027177EE6|nr:class I SAM-dependent methyltransferase [Candidatus Binatus sp.]MDO8433017.1 class I SAM-dependent methyltransferase [Candidatus Binatus sp.]